MFSYQRLTCQSVLALRNGGIEALQLAWAMAFAPYAAIHLIVEKLEAISHSGPLPHLSLATVRMDRRETESVADNKDDYSTYLQHFHAMEADYLLHNHMPSQKSLEYQKLSYQYS
ncbi:MAG: hypothetical protein HOD99_03955 [Planctomycetaceae bacterium]|nr:hypothetical protein [Planctomycetaceae bacterium]